MECSVCGCEIPKITVKLSDEEIGPSYVFCPNCKRILRLETEPKMAKYKPVKVQPDPDENRRIHKELVRRLEIRKKQLLGEVDLGYKLHSGHHLRDVFTVLAVLKNDPKAEQLVNNLPELPEGET